MEEHFFNWMKHKDSAEKGGKGSGNFDHTGRPGKVGGSGDGIQDVAEQQFKKNQGFSLSIHGESPKDGFMVSVYPEKGVSTPPEKITRDFLRRFVKKNIDILRKDEHYLGAWIENGMAFIDVSIRVKSGEEAKKLCLRYDQIAYYDVVKGESVVVNPNAKGAETIMKNYDPETKSKEDEKPKNKEKIFFKVDENTTDEELDAIVRYLNGEEEKKG